MADSPSRLSNGNIYYKGNYIPIEEYRNMIAARNLYDLNNEYESTQLFSSKNLNNVANGISTVLTVIPQYNRIQTGTNLAGNVIDALRDEGSPLAKIGLIMLGKQMAYNSAMNLAVKYLPSVNLSQALKGHPDKIFTRNENNTITVKNEESKTFLDKVGSVASNFLGIDTYDVFGDANPFTKNPTNIEYIKNTGEGQLKRFFQAINLNPYKQLDSVNNKAYADTLQEYSDKVGIPLLSGEYVVQNRVYFNFIDRKYHPYFKRTFLINPTAAAENANKSIRAGYSISGSSVQEYAPYYDYIEDNFGHVKKTIEVNDVDNYVGEETIFRKDNKKENLVWGRDGVGIEAKANLENLRGDVDTVVNNPDEGVTNGLKTGLLEYTRNLLNASEGNFVDITRKVYKDGTRIVGFNGSPLWRANNSTYAQANGIDGKTGHRQHTVLDPYDRFAKAIRFKGNIVYRTEGGNKDSVIYDTVMPKIHPTKDENGNINNKNLMFSLENLAVSTVTRPDGKYGIIDDEYGTPIPLSEVGRFGGRLMWFPPYNIQLNEVAAAKYDSTVMVGRNEPMYTYMNSERSAVLSFSLMVDYPEQLRRIELQGKNKNKAIADFFAYGGDPIPTEYQIEVVEKKIEDLKQQINTINGLDETSEPPNLDTSDISVYFPNDKPTAGEVSTIFDTMYNTLHYEIIQGLESADNGNGFGLNYDFYFKTGLTETSAGVYSLTATTGSQYSEINETDQFGASQLNKGLWDVFRNEDYRKYYKIEITGTASKLYLGANEQAYNEALGNRRVEATKNLILSKLTKMFGKNVADDIEIVTKPSTGSVGMSNAGAEPKNMHEKSVKEERSAVISFKRNNLSPEKKKITLTPKQIEDNEKIQKDIQNLEQQLAYLKKNLTENIYNERKDSEDAILTGFESISDNKFYPVFHSQTPEDFHRRLTFLHQCTRQGAAKRWDLEEDNYGTLRARNSVFGRQPICILRVGDFWYTKVIIETVTIDYADAPWDMNPEGFGMQPMMANVTLNMKVIGGQSLKGPIDALQNAVTFNYYANSNFTDKDVYGAATREADNQEKYLFGVDGKSGVVGDKKSALLRTYNEKFGISE